ncbi:hypothetical protein J6590_082757 [Homalodisca vitripennis]|nr:hypothetical protein J6590_082757 [Homalodisca vitripennis]
MGETNTSFSNLFPGSLSLRYCGSFRDKTLLTMQHVTILKKSYIGRRWAASRERDTWSKRKRSNLCCSVLQLWNPSRILP